MWWIIYVLATGREHSRTDDPTVVARLAGHATLGVVELAGRPIDVYEWDE